MKILKKNKKSHLTKTMFLDEGVDIARYDHVRYPVIDKITLPSLLPKHKGVIVVSVIFNCCIF